MVTSGTLSYNIDNNFILVMNPLHFLKTIASEEEKNLWSKQTHFFFLQGFKLCYTVTSLSRVMFHNRKALIPTTVVLPQNDNKHMVLKKRNTSFRSNSLHPLWVGPTYLDCTPGGTDKSVFLLDLAAHTHALIGCTWLTCRTSPDVFISLN